MVPLIIRVVLAGSMLCASLPSSGGHFTTFAAFQQNLLIVVVKLPMSKAEFATQEPAFVLCLSSSFGIQVTMVRIQKVIEVFTRTLQFPARRLLNSAVVVSSTVETSNHVDQSFLRQQFVLFGLPSPTSLDIWYPSNQTSASSSTALSTSSPEHADSFKTSSATETSLSVEAVGAIGGVGGFVVFLALVFCWCKSRNLGVNQIQNNREKPFEAVVLSENGPNPSKAVGKGPESIACKGESKPLETSLEDLKFLQRPETSISTNNLRNNLVDEDDLRGQYLPISKYADVIPNESCRESIIICSRVLEIPRETVEQVLVEVNKVTTSRLNSHESEKMLSEFSSEERESYVSAIVMYTFELPHGHVREENFYFRLNQILRQRNSKHLQYCASYLHYLMKGLENLPCCSAGLDLWRGVDSAGRQKLLQHYKLGRKIHWSGFSSASTEQQVAKGFAGSGGILLRVRLVENSRSRDIRALSALPNENEILLLPNFAVRVASGAHEIHGCAILELLEEVENSTFVF